MISIDLMGSYRDLRETKKKLLILPAQSLILLKQSIDQVTLPNRMNFRKIFKGGEGGSFSIQKFTLQILDFYKGLFSDVFRKKIAI